MKLADGTPLTQSSTLGLTAQWLKLEANKAKTEDEFWALVVDLHEDGLNNDQEDSLKARRKINKHLVPPDFLIQLNFVLDQIFQNNYSELKKRNIRIKVK